VTTPLINRFNPVLQKRLGLSLGVWGEAGIGKSHVLQELLRTLPCRSSSLHATSSLAVLARTLPKPKKLARWAENNLERLAKGETVENSNVLDSLGTILSSLAPFVLHLEDIHEADEERFSFIQELAKVVSHSKGVGLVVTSRKEPLDPFTALKLEPLSKQEADALLERELKANLPKEALSFIYNKAAGNPLYTLEYLRYLTRQGFLWNDGRVWHWRKPTLDTVPVTVEALIEELIEKVKTEDLQRYVLETKAFLPLQATHELWAKVARVGEQTLQAVITELSQQGIFRGRDFAHPLFREVTLKALNANRKHYLARRAINALKDTPGQAVPFIEDAGLTNDEVLEMLEKAARDATELGDKARAARFRAKAVDYMEGERQSQQAFEAAVSIYSYDLTEAIRLLELAHLTKPGDFEVFKRLTIYLAQAGRRAEAEKLLGTVPSKARTSPNGLMLTIAVNHYLQDHKRAVEVWDTHPELHAIATPTTVRNVAFSKADLGDVRGALELASKTLHQPQLTVEEQAILLETCGYAHHNNADFATAVTYYDEAIRLFRADNQAHRNGSLLFNRAIALQGLGRVSESLADAQEALELAVEGGHALFYANAQLALAATQLEQGDYENAEKRLLECQVYYQQNNMTVWLMDTLVVLSDLYREWPVPYAGVLAHKHASKALTLARETQNPRFLLSVTPYTVLAEALFGEPQRAIELADESIHMSGDGLGNTLTQAKIRRGRALALSRLGLPSKALSEFQQALNILQQAGLVIETQKVGLELDRLNDDTEHARKRMQWFEERGLLNGANIAKRLFPALAEQKEMVKQVENQVRLEVLGSLQVRGNNVSAIRGRKRQELLALLLEARIAGRSEVSRLTLFDTLYPDDDELKASGSLKNLVHSLRETLGENTITTTNNGYALGSCNSDAELFLRTLDTALWRGVYLEGLAAEESTVRDALYLSLFEKTKALLETSPTEAARVGGILVEADPYNTEYLKIYLTALRLSKNHGKLTRYYKEARERWLEVGETLPETWQGFLG
jgi:tetratricopeptide (TPR) repeat protein